MKMYIFNYFRFGIAKSEYIHEDCIDAVLNHITDGYMDNKFYPTSLTDAEGNVLYEGDSFVDKLWEINEKAYT